MSDPLSSAEKRALRSAERARVVTNLEWLAQHQFRRGRLIGATNRYREGERLLGRDLTNGTVRKKDLGLYVAAATILHCSDAWAYLGRALDALGRGDQGAAIHLGYYSSLRASLSLLASEGIGTFNRNHVIADERPWLGGTPPAIRKRGTHEIAWLALDQWASYRRAGDLIGSIITPAGVPLTEWLVGPGGEPWRPIARNWLRIWGADLKQYSRDQRLRNRASYRPEGGPQPLPQQSVVEFLVGVWDAIDPRPGRLFAALDLELLRLALEASFQGRTDRSAIDDSEYAAEVRVRLAEEPVATEQLEEYLLRISGRDDSLIIKNGQQRTGAGSPSTAHEVLARSVLLLRLATGSTRGMIRAAGVDQAGIGFWWVRLLRGRGLLGDSDPPTDLIELWDEVAPYHDEARGLVQSGGPRDAFTWLMGHAELHVALTGTERGAVVGVLA